MACAEHKQIQKRWQNWQNLKEKEYLLETLGNSLADHLNMAHYSGPASESQRVMHLNKKRERELEEIEIKKRKLENDLKGTFKYYVSTFLWFLDPYLWVILGQWDILIWPPLVSRFFFRCLVFEFFFFTNADVVTIKDETSKENLWNQWR